MAYRRGNREQYTLLPPAIDEYVGEEDPVRVFDAFVEALELKELGIQLEEVKVGNSSYDPRAMLKILVYGYAYGWRSSRKLERALHHNLSFIWLAGGLKPDHKTIANFRRNNIGALKKVLKHSVRLCLDLKLIEGNTLFVDGTKIRANASIQNTWTEKRCRKVLAKSELTIAKILQECERTDKKESGSYIKLSQELSNKQGLQSKVHSIMEKIRQEERTQLNEIDPDCAKMRGRQGSHAGYNAQLVVDEKHGLIVNSDVANENNDVNQFTEQVKQANETLGEKCATACADAGYANVSNLKETVGQEIAVVVPNQKQALHHLAQDDPFGKEKFSYEEAENQYHCPMGQALRYSHYSKKKKHYLYRMQDGGRVCKACEHYGRCTTSARGRAIIRLKDERLKEELARFYNSKRGQEIYEKRKSKVELPFGHIKRNLGVGSFLLRGFEGVKGEMALLSTCFNISRMITLLGAPVLKQVLQSRKTIEELFQTLQRLLPKQQMLIGVSGKHVS